MQSVDAVGIAFFGAYWNWLESTFEGLVAHLSGSSWREVLASGLSMPVVHAEIDYEQPLRLSEQVAVEMRVARVGSRSVRFCADFRNDRGDLVAEAATVHVVLGTAGERVEMPVWLVNAGEADIELPEQGEH